MLGVHALVAEDAAHLIHPVKAAHDQPLQRQLGFNAQIHIHIQGIVMGDKGPGGGADLQRQQDGGVHLQKSLFIQIIPDLPQNAAALDKGVFDLRVDDQIHIPLAVAQVHVLQAVEFFRQRQQAFAQQLDLVRLDADLPHFGAEDLALHADNVADVKFLESGVGLVAHVIPADIQLNIAGGIPQVGKAGLAHHPLAHQAAAQADGGVCLLLRLQVGKLLFDGGGAAIHWIFGDSKRVFAGGAQGLQLVPADAQQLPHFLLLRLLLLVPLFFVHNFILHAKSRGIPQRRGLLIFLQPFGL